MGSRQYNPHGWASMEKLRGRIQPDNVSDAFAVVGAEGTESETKSNEDLMYQLFQCTQCCLEGKHEYMFPATAFGVYSHEDLIGGILQHGAWARCTECAIAASRRKAKGLGVVP